MTGSVMLVGAGCLSRDLITVRGLECLRRADAVVYDDLLADGLLEEARPDARLHYVGKRSGRHSLPQREISALLIGLARRGQQVCRLKGGDPFVFGRGGEEAEALRQAGISLADALDRNDAYHALDAAGALIRTGATGTNVNDVTILLIEGEEP